MRERYPTDLTDPQWERLWERVFHPAGYAESVREVVDALRFCEKACAVWCLLPDGFPPAEAVEEHRSRWEADGTWERVGAVIDEKAPLGPFGRFRKRVSRLIRALPAGHALWHAAAAPIHAYQWLSALAQKPRRRIRCFHRAIDEGDLHRAKKEYEAAIREYDRAGDLFPSHPQPKLGRATCLSLLSEHADVAPDCWRALATPLLLPHQRYEAHALLGRSIALTGGDVDRAARHLAEGWWGHERPGPGFRAALGEVGLVETLMAAHDDLAEWLINNHMAFAAALELWRRKPAVRAEHPTRLDACLPPRTLYLSDDWVRNIGHIAYLDTYAKMRALGWTDWDQGLLPAPPQGTSNKHYLSYWADRYTIVTDRRLIETLRAPTRVYAPRVAHLIRCPDGTERYFLESLGIVQEAWERDGRPPLLSLTAADRDYGRGVLRALGVPADAWFVCLHVREPGYHKEFGNTHQSHRNADVLNYLPALREITRRGGWVVRMGDPSMTPLPKMRGVVDYALSDLKTERMDVFLCGASRFFLGVASGLCQLPTTFGVPCVLTNWASNALPLYSCRDLFIPKPIRSVAEDRVLTFEEMYADPVRHAAYSGVFLFERGLQAIENTPEELRDVVTEMLDQLDGTAVYSAADVDLQGRFAGVLRGHGQDGFARLGRAFLRQHAHLFETRSVPPRAAA
jgi:putative glycosyltransferase (TIGR04372 family)